jgi:hypothetical protein
MAREMGMLGNMEDAAEIARKHRLVEDEIEHGNTGVDMFVRAANRQRDMRRIGGGNVISPGKKTLGTRRTWKRTIPVVGIPFIRERELNPAVIPTSGIQ